ncbi:histone acetyltransferase HAC12-like [Senna tora]|uniref:histone acetyltransferase n=1 Tax=Senna tora TaxID=362788 RepID=A0A834XDD1_9FABA|nr:histone acetyltransferase HAC12-like [Senna tora]
MNLGQKSRRSLSNNVSSQPLLGRSDLRHQYERNQVSHFQDWRKDPRIDFLRNVIRCNIAAILRTGFRYEGLHQASDAAAILEHKLFAVAASENEYLDQSTLIQRVQKLHGTTMYSPQVNNTNKHEFPKGQPSHPFTVAASSQSVLSSNSFIPQHVTTRQVSQALNDFPTHSSFSQGSSSSSTLGNITQFQPHKLDSSTPSPAKRFETEPTFGVSMINDETCDLWKIVESCSAVVNESNKIVIDDDAFELDFESETISQGIEACHTLEDSLIPRNLRENVSSSNLQKDLVVAEENTRKEVLEEGTKSSNLIINGVSNGAFEQISNTDIISEAKETSVDVISKNLRENVGISEYSINAFQNDPPLADMEVEQNGIDFNKTDLEEGTEFFNPEVSGEQTFEIETVSEGIEAARHTSVDSYLKSHDVNVSQSNSSIHAFQKDPRVDVEGENGTSGFNQTEKNITNVIEPKSDLEERPKSSNSRISGVSLTEAFTPSQIKEHIRSLQQHFGQSTPQEEIEEIGDYSCSLCGMHKLSLTPVPIFCLSCGNRISRNANYYYRSAQESDTEDCFCSSCYMNSQGGSIKFNGESISKTTLESTRNDDVPEEDWAQCDKCKRWQHQICALFDSERNLECKVEYVCPHCCLEELENGVRVPLPENAIFERADRAKIEGKNVDEILKAENLSVRVVSSVEKQLKVEEQFLDIHCEKNYPVEFPYKSKLILLFQKIEGVDVCLYGMYVQEFGSECGRPNQRSVYISYLDSVKYFRPEREVVPGEALRTFVYHEILIGYLEFCKKRGFATCYLWACPSMKGQDYLLYCHPESQKTPKSDQLRHWYHSMLRKAAKENIVVGCTNMYDHFFVPTEKSDSKVTAARLPYFDGDYCCGTAMDLISDIEKESKGQYEKMVKKVLSKRALKSMGYTNPSRSTSKDILLMHKLGETISSFKEDLMVVHLQYVCTHCHEAILSGKRWFCSKCKEYQQCERCHSDDTHTCVGGKRHKLHQVVVDDVPLDTKESDTVLDNDLFENRSNFWSFCQDNHFQFDSLRRAKHTSMMLLHHLQSPTLMDVDTT